MPRIKHLEEKFSIASYELIKQCSSNELRFYLWLKLWAINKNSAWPSYKTICSDLGMAKSTLSRLIEEMEKNGRLKIIKKFGFNNIYDISWYDQLRNATGGSSETLPLPVAKRYSNEEKVTTRNKTIKKFLNFNSFNKNKEVRKQINNLMEKISI